jgi:hypothetical protein
VNPFLKLAIASSARWGAFVPGYGGCCSDIVAASFIREFVLAIYFEDSRDVRGAEIIASCEAVP